MTTALTLIYMSMHSEQPFMQGCTNFRKSTVDTHATCKYHLDSMEKAQYVNSPEKTLAAKNNNSNERIRAR